VKVLLDAVDVVGEPVQLLVIPDQERSFADKQDWPDAAYYFEIEDNTLFNLIEKLSRVAARRAR
jgi:hypothetical protein